MDRRPDQSGYLGLPAFLRRESRSLGIWLDNWFMRDHAHDRAAARRAGASALESIDKVATALAQARDQLATELRQD